jgi:xanthosine utilization system XapX-like protein
MGRGRRGGGSARGPTGLLLVRFALPAAIAVAGVVLIVVGDEFAQGAGIVLVGVAGLVALANAFMRLALQSERDREREEARRSGREGPDR